MLISGDDDSSLVTVAIPRKDLLAIECAVGVFKLARRPTTVSEDINLKRSESDQ